MPSLLDAFDPSLWQDHTRWCALDTGGAGLQRVLALWQRWHQAPGRGRHLHLVLLMDDAATAAAAWEQLSAQASLQPAARLADDIDAELLLRLQTACPALTPNLHPLDLEPGRVQLLLCLGPLARLLPRLRLQAQLLWLQAAAAQPAPQRLRILKAVARLGAPGALALAAPTDDSAAARLPTDLLSDLRTAGFEPDAPSPGLQARLRPWPRANTPLSANTPHPASTPAPANAPPQAVPALAAPRSALVIGAGLAGAAAAQALSQQGLQVTVLDRHQRPAAETSGNPAGLFHGTVNPDDGPYARLFRAAALVAQRRFAAGAVPHQAEGLLRLQTAADGTDPLPDMRAQLQRLGLPTTYVQALDAAQASALAGVPLATPAWFYPGAGWVSPADWVQAVLNLPGVQFHGGVAVDAITPTASGWQALDTQGRVLGQAEVLVLACAVNSPRLLQRWSPGLHWPLRQTRGQVTQLQAVLGAPQPGRALRLPVAGDGYALPLTEAGGLLCGATRQAVPLRDRPGPHRLQADARSSDPGGDHSTAADHAHNLLRLQRLAGLHAAPGASLLGRVGYRLHSDDRLPIVGGVPRPGPVDAALKRLDQARRWPRWPGLFVFTALGARGLTLAPLLGQLVAAQATGAPWPLEQDLADAVDPVRWLLREARAAGASGPEVAKGATRAKAAPGG